jgi:ATP-dependent Clp endopeptidase proteolytic subunit ClpP
MEDRVYRQGRIVFLSGVITQESAGEVINHLLNLIQYDDQEDEKQKEYKREDIKLFIKSNGGTVTDMFGMIDLIESSKTPINTYAIGNIASAAVPLFISGKKRYIYKNTEVMIHTCSGGTRGKIQDMIETIKNVEDTQVMIDNYILSKTKIAKERLVEVREKKLDWYLYADEAVKLGIADEIL